MTKHLSQFTHLATNSSTIFGTENESCFICNRYIFNIMNNTNYRNVSKIYKIPDGIT